MALFTSLDRADLEAVVAAYGLPRLAQYEPLAAGTVNTNARLVLEGGRQLFLRVNEGKTAEQVAYEEAVLTHLAARGVPTPSPLFAPGGRRVEIQGKILTLFPWVEGRHLAPGEVKAASVEAVGRALGELHVAGADFADRHAGIYTLDHIQARYEGFAASRDPLLMPYLPSIGAELARLPGERDATLPSGIIHQDLFRDNVLFDGDRLVALLDFEQAVWGSFAYDIAVTLLAWCFVGQQFDPELVAALLRGYEQVRPITTQERAGLWVEMRVAAVRFTVTRITDVYLKGIRGGKDFRSYAARMRALAERPTF